ncbi:MAG: WD40 repeat domain-containing protein [Planctomycetota bacterium]
MRLPTRCPLAALAALATLVAADAPAREAAVFSMADPVADARPAVVTALALSADGRRVVAGGDDHVLRVWDAATPSRPIATLRAHTDWVRATRFLPGDDRVASVAADRALCLWRLDDSNPRPAPNVRRLAGGPLRAVALHPDGRRVATAGFSDSVRLYDLEDGTAEPIEHGCPCEDTRAVAFSPDGRWMAAAGRNGVVRLWDLVASGGARDLPTDGRRIRALAFSPGGETLAAGGDGPAVRLWAIESPTVQAGDPGAAPTELIVRPGKVHALAFVDDRTLAVGGTRDDIVLWDTLDASPRRTLTGHTGAVAAFAVSADGSVLASGSFDTTVRLWSLGRAAAAADAGTTTR